MNPITTTRSPEELLREIEALRRRLEEAEEALRVGEMDARLVEPGREQAHTLDLVENLSRPLVADVLARQAADLVDRRGAQEALHTNEGHLRQMLDAVPMAIYSTDARGRLTYFNPAAVEFSGRVPELGTDQWCVSWKLYHADGTPMPYDECPMAVALREGRAVRGVESIAERPDGRRIWFVPYPTPLLDSEGRIVGGINMLLDISERKEVEKARALLSAIVDSSDDAIISKDLSGVITSWNRGAERLFGYTSAEAVGKSITMLIPPERRHEEPAIIERLKAGERVDHFDTIRVRKDGSPIPISLTISPVRDAHGRVTGASKIARDITGRKETERALREADRRKDEFLATLAHELRNPLAPVRNAVHILLTRGSADPQLVRSHKMIDRQVRNMARLLDDLLDVSRISRNKLELKPERVEMRSVVEAALEVSAPLVEAAGHTLTVTLPDQPVYIEADPVRLSQVFANLLNNAAKYTDQAGRIALSAHRQGGDVVVSVKDTGIGISAQVLPRIFEISSQAASALDRAQGGLGIGLSLVKGLVELHGGSVWAHSDGPGRGSEFIVRLPAVGPEPARTPPPPPPAPEPAMPKFGLRILIADDNEDSADSLAMLLKLQGHEVVAAYDGEAALAAAEAMRPDVALLDIGMPKLDGFEVCRRIREQPWGHDIHLLALTGWAQDDDVRRAAEAGFDQHHVKPVDLNELARLLASVPKRGAGPVSP